jgi:hypothetical protein
MPMDWPSSTSFAKMPNRYLLPLLLVLGHAFAGQAQSVRKYSNEFLSIGIGARNLAMAGSSVASTGDVTAGYWNPAGLVGVSPDLQVGAMHAEYFAGEAKFDYASVVLPVKETRRLGISLIRFGVDDIPNTLFLFEPDGSINYNNITSFSVADYALLLSYAQPLGPEGLRIGGSGKIIYRNAGSFAQAWGFGFDAGLQYARGNWRLGLMARDLTTTVNAWSFSFTEEEAQVLQATGNAVPESSTEITAPRIILGAAYRWPISESFGLLAEANVDLTTDGKRNVLLSADPVSADPHLGIELDYADFIFLRAGIGNVQRATTDEDLTERLVVQPNMGLGLRIKGVQLDYAYTNIGSRDQLLYSHVFSLMLDINPRSRPQSEG